MNMSYTKELHRLLYDGDLKAATVLIESENGQDFAKEKDDGDLPLHVAVCYSVTKNSTKEVFGVIKLLLEKYPEGIKIRDCEGELPIHIASHTSLELMIQLADVYPEGLTMTGCMRTFPFHLVAIHWNGIIEEREERIEKMKELISKYPDVLKLSDDSGNLPIHCFTLKKDLECVKECAARYPGSLMHENKKGELPIHEAAKRSCAFEILKYLINEEPDGLKHKNKDGRLPIHIAASNFREDNMRLLTEKYPKGLIEVDSNNHNPVSLLLEDSSISLGWCIEIVSNLLKTIAESRNIAESENEKLKSASDKVRLLVDQHEALKQVLIETRKSECACLGLIHPTSAPIGELKMIAQSLMERLDVTLNQDKTNKDRKPSLLHVLFSSAMKNPETSTLIDVIQALNSELSTLEIERLGHNAVSDGGKKHPRDAAAAESPEEPAEKRSRASL